MENAKPFYSRRKRTLPLAAVLALAVAAGGLGMIAYGPLRSATASLTNSPAASANSRAPLMKGSTTNDEQEGPGAKVVTRAILDVPANGVDAAPTGSIGRVASAAPDRGASLLPDLSASIPSGVGPSLRQAALAGSPAAQYELARRLFEGRGVPRDQLAAASWFERAASAGFAPAEFRLGALYQKGAGVELDPTAARRWYAAAARAGNALAAHNLGVMHAELIGEANADYVEAAKWFRRAAEMGLRDSQFNLGVLYARGLGLERNLARSWMWFSLSAAQGDAEAARKRDEVAGQMDSGALAAARDQLSKFKAIEPDPAANDVAANSGKWEDPGPATTAAPLGQGPRPGP